MLLKVGDKVRSVQGPEGCIVLITDDRKTVFVRLAAPGPGPGLVAYSTGDLVLIDAYSIEPGPPT